MVKEEKNSLGIENWHVSWAKKMSWCFFPLRRCGGNRDSLNRTVLIRKNQKQPYHLDVILLCWSQRSEKKLMSFVNLSFIDLVFCYLICGLKYDCPFKMWHKHWAMSNNKQHKYINKHKVGLMMVLTQPGWDGEARCFSLSSNPDQA